MLGRIVDLTQIKSVFLNSSTYLVAAMVIEILDKVTQQALYTL